MHQKHTEHQENTLLPQKPHIQQQNNKKRKPTPMVLSLAIAPILPHVCG